MTPSIKDTFGHNCSYHPPTLEGTRRAHEEARDAIRTCGNKLLELTPQSREQSIAITKLEEAMMWANAAIARSHYDPFGEAKEVRQ
jgi:hypothetical protein